MGAGLLAAGHGVGAARGRGGGGPGPGRATAVARAGRGRVRPRVGWPTPACDGAARPPTSWPSDPLSLARPPMPPRASLAAILAATTAARTPARSGSQAAARRAGTGAPAAPPGRGPGLGPGHGFVGRLGRDRRQQGDLRRGDLRRGACLVPGVGSAGAARGRPRGAGHPPSAVAPEWVLAPGPGPARSAPASRPRISCRPGRPPRPWCLRRGRAGSRLKIRPADTSRGSWGRQPRRSRRVPAAAAELWGHWPVQPWMASARPGHSRLSG